jgi:hypothetical protein
MKMEELVISKELGEKLRNRSKELFIVEKISIAYIQFTQVYEKCTTLLGDAETLNDAYDLIEENINYLKNRSFLLESYRITGIISIDYRISKSENGILTIIKEERKFKK